MDASNKAESPRMWWTGLVVFGLASLALNIAHAVKTPDVDGWVAVLVGLIPVVACAFMSHGITDRRPGAAIWVVRTGILIVFIMGMILSVDAQAAMVHPVLQGNDILVPLVLDLSTFISLFMIMSASSTAEKAARLAAVQAELATAKAELRPAVRAEVRAELEAELEAELRRKSNVIRAEAMEEVRAEVEMGAEAEVATRVAAAEVEIRNRLAVEIEARVRRELAEAASTKGDRLPASTTVTDGMTSEDKARILLAENPGMTGAELGRALGKTERYGRILLERIQTEDAQQTSTRSAE